MIRFAIASVMTVVSISPLLAQPDAWYPLAVKSLDATIEPATAAPGQTVTFRVTLHLNFGYRTYPTVQPDKLAVNQTTTFEFPPPGDLIFVGDVIDPPKPESKAEPKMGIKDLRYYEGKVIFERKAVVSPRAKAGESKIELKAMEVNVCNSDGNCFPSKTVKPSATFTVKGEAVVVDKAYAEAVEKALAGK